ncbi:MAG: permease [Geminicoccaceae bacterium]|nr:permease [Geminicoccaceae bacterium]
MSMTGDLRYAVRSMRRRPGFTTVAILTLALGIGANAAIFSAVRGILLRPLPFREPDRLVAFNAEQFIANAELLYLREHARTLSTVGAMSPGWGMALTGVGEATQLTTGRVSPNLFEMLGVRPTLGRSFQAEESTPGRETVAILGHALWTERFGSDPSVIGRRITLDGTPYTVVGILPQGFEILGRSHDLWTPLVIDAGAWFHRGAVSWMVARLRAGTTVDQARSEVAALMPQMRAAFEFAPDYYRNATLVPLHERTVGSVRTVLIVLLAAVGFIVLIAGANVGNLLLMRAAARRREIAVRTALGATRGRVIGQLLVESVVLALAGAAAGAALGAAGVRVLRASLPSDIPRVSAIVLDAPVLLVCATLAIIIGIVFGLAPAFLASGGDVQESLRGSRGVAGRVGGERARGTLVVAEVALTLVLVIGAGLMMQTLWSLTHVSPGFRSHGVLTMRLQPTGERYGNAQIAPYVSTVLDRLRPLPGVQSTGSIHHLPLAGYAWYANIDVEGRVRAPNETPLRSGWRVISGDYFQAMGIPLLSGREFTAADAPDAPPVVIVSDAFARAAWPNENPIGKRFLAGNATRGGAVTVVGVVGGVRHVTLDAAPGPELYRPLAQTPMPMVTVVVRTAGDPLAVASLAREAIRGIDADVPISEVQTVDQVLSASVARPRLVMALLLVFAGVGVILGAVGVYGVIAYAVGERRREIGVRIALGADPRVVAGSVVWHGVRYAAIGVALGVAGAFAATRVMRTLLFGVSPTDPVTFVGLSAFLIGIAALASYLPARSAARTDPMVALRSD